MTLLIVFDLEVSKTIAALMLSSRQHVYLCILFSLLDCCCVIFGMRENYSVYYHDLYVSADAVN